jgi:hypothetical protein
MSDLRTRADSLREYLTGAGIDAGAQTDTNLSLGGFRSETEARSLGIVLTNALFGITVDYASGSNGWGNGVLTAVSADYVSWQTPGGSVGPSLFLPAPNSTGLAESGGDPASYLRITRITTDPIQGGPCTVNLNPIFDNVFGFKDVASADASTGISEYRCTMIRNEAAGDVLNLARWIATLASSPVSDVLQLGVSGSGSIQTSASFADWPDAGWCRIETSGGVLREIVYYTSRTGTVLTVPATGRARLGTVAAAGAITDSLYAVPGIALAIDPTGVQFFGTGVQSIPNATTAPAGVSWNTGIRKTTGLLIGSLPTSHQVGIWMWREMPAGAVSTPSALDQTSTYFDAT